MLIGGNLTVNGAVEYTNVTNLYVQDPIIEMGGNANAGALTSNDGKDRGTLLHYYTTQTVDAFMGWKNSAGEFVFASNANLTVAIPTAGTPANGWAVAAGATKVVTVNQSYSTINTVYFAGITASGSANVYITPGEGL